MSKSDNKPRPRETRYYGNINSSKPLSRGYPKGDTGSVQGAAKAVAAGYVRKVKGIDRDNGGRVLWTVLAEPRIPGVAMVPFRVVKGDADAKGRAK